MGHAPFAMAIGGIILFIGIMVLVYILISLLRTPKGRTEYSIGEVMETAEATPRIFVRWGVWIGVSVVLILIAYTVPLMGMLNHPSAGSEGFIMW